MFPNAYTEPPCDSKVDVQAVLERARKECTPTRSTNRRVQQKRSAIVPQSSGPSSGSAGPSTHIDPSSIVNAMVASQVRYMLGGQMGQQPLGLESLPGFQWTQSRTAPPVVGPTGGTGNAMLALTDVVGAAPGCMTAPQGPTANPSPSGDLSDIQQRVTAQLLELQAKAQDRGKQIKGSRKRREPPVPVDEPEDAEEEDEEAEEVGEGGG